MPPESDLHSGGIFYSCSIGFQLTFQISVLRSSFIFRAVLFVFASTVSAGGMKIMSLLKCSRQALKVRSDTFLTSL